MDTTYRLTQTGAEVQEYLNQVPVSKGDIEQLQQQVTAFLNSQQVQTMIDAALANYSTTEQVTAAIASAIGTALASYSTTSQMDAAIQSAITTALASYSTTQEVTAAINGAITTALSAYYTKQEVDTALAGKQATLTFDLTPTANSSNPVTSNGVKVAVDGEATARSTADGQLMTLIQQLQASLLNYYLKTETYSKSQVDQLVAAVGTFQAKIVNTLPEPTADTCGFIFLVPATSTQTTNVKEEYITVLDGSTYKWEHIGSTNIDLSGYSTTEQMNTAISTALADYTTTANLTLLLAQKQDTISDLQTIRSGSAAGATAYQKPAGGIPESDLDAAAQAKMDAGATAVQPASIADMEVVTNKVTSLSDESTDTQYPSAKSVYDFVKEETGKARETVSVEATASSGSVSSSAVLNIKVGGVVVAQGTGALSYAIEYGTQYTVEAERVYDFLTPASQTFTAGQSVRTVTMAYTYIARDTITIDQTETDELTMVSGDVQGDVIKAIRAASHLYLGTQTEAGNQLICQLKDDDGTKYADGTTAAMDGTEGDQWLKLPVFWWKVTGIGTPDESDTYDQYSFSFAFAGEPDPAWHKWEGDMNLLGAKKMYVADEKGYSRSGIQGSVNFTQATGNSYAAARGTGYATVTWEWHWMMCVLFYAWYGRMNSQAQCGIGSNSNTRTLGTNDSLGMTDTTSANGNSDNTKFWGIENWWGDIYEWIGNITSENYVVTIIDMNTKQSRTVSGWLSMAGSGGYASRFKITEDLDFIPRAKNSTDTTSYCDYVNGNSGSRVVVRSNYGAGAHGGVADVSSSGAPSYSSANVGSRLAFNGVVTEAESVAAYKAAFAAGE